MCGTADDSGDATPRNSVARLIEQHDMSGVGEELERFWTATGDDHRSLRDLAGYFNRRLLAEHLADAGVQTVEGEPANIYRLLTADDVAEGDRILLRRRLERQDVDVDHLVDQFVSYQTIRRYLTDVREASYERPAVDPRERESQNLQQLRGRVEAVTRGKLEQLRQSDLTLGDFQVTANVRVYCEDCESQFDVSSLLERGHCDCA